MSVVQQIMTVVVIVIATQITRFLPFVLFKKNTPASIQKLTDSLPYAMMGLLVVYSLKGLSLETILPTSAAVLVLVCVHLYKRNTLLSILVSTIVYMLLL